MIKINSAKILLGFAMLAGGAVGASFYNQVLSIFGRVIESRYVWILAPVLVGLLIYVFQKLRHASISDQERLGATNKIELRVLLTGFVSGFFLLYMMLAVAGIVALVTYLVIHFFYS